MKTIIEYTIYCTEEQTKKALELGAPIDETAVMPPTMLIEEKIYSIPTAEQIVGWLEEQDEIHYIYIDNIVYAKGEGWYYCVFDKDGCNVRFNSDFESRREATIAAIDAALDYLEDKKK